MGIRATIFGFITLALPVAAEPGATLDPARTTLEEAQGGVFVRVGLDRKTPFRALMLDNPPRLILDFQDMSFGAVDTADLAWPDTVRAVNWGALWPGWARMVVELDGPHRIVTASAEDPPGILVRLVRTDTETFAGLVNPGAAMPPGLPQPAIVDRPKERQTGDAPLVVVIDPGHGGLDPGAQVDDLVEADLMLTFAQELRDLLEEADMRVVLTREQDAFVPLEIRTSVARIAGADVFLSLHADALAEGVATGATIYLLSDEASDQAGALLAQRHDRADLLAGVDLTQQDDQVASVLMDMARTETRPRTRRLAQSLVTAIRESGGELHARPIQSGAFSVLKAPDIPSVLVELGFMSSPADLKRLTDPAWRALMQDAILSALQVWATEDAAEAELLRQ